MWHDERRIKDDNWSVKISEQYRSSYIGHQSTQRCSNKGASIRVRNSRGYIWTASNRRDASRIERWSISSPLGQKSTVPTRSSSTFCNVDKIFPAFQSECIHCSSGIS